MWLGYSAEGPGQAKLSSAKPDVCASSQFGEKGDFSRTGSNTGTSAACGLSAGVVAAIRNRRAFDVLPPDDLRDLLRDNAWLPLVGADAERRFGQGIIDAERTVNNLPSAFASPPRRSFFPLRIARFLARRLGLSFKKADQLS
jgi:hypothetical protein